MTVGIISGVISGILTVIICFYAARYWSNRSIKSLNRRIEEKEAYKTRLDNLAKSDRALLIAGFQAVLAVAAFICGIIVIQLLLLIRQTDVLGTLVFMLLWLLPILVCAGIVKMLEDIRNHPESLGRIERQIKALKSKLLSRK
jgi:H+/gluconate symporter-like permease